MQRDTMTLEQAIVELRKPSARADKDGTAVLVALYPYGVARGGTDWLVRLTPTQARILAAELLAAAE